MARWSPLWACGGSPGRTRRWPPTTGCRCWCWSAPCGRSPSPRTARSCVRPVLPLTATFDHRYTDGFHAARFAAALGEYCADPARFEPQQSRQEARAAE
ncbi:2-oxo acid dehydrogenase subunit E2 [Nonomuraea basaltis]|uniref:2-oxo acid dehydrogenase subunit E2 n=1 Tax=Nonomuraea basaltis TaxID=2495887 RepID=UPI0014875F82